ncbi:MAG: anion permease [Halobacteriales archaeon]|nr:anion permease [Halobacteriales archaeon]
MALVTIIVAIIASLFMAWALGASSNSPPFAPAVGANALPTMRAAFLIGIFAGAGALLQGGSISKTVGTGLIQNAQITPLAATAGLLTAATFIAVGVRTGYPIPAAFAVTGAMIGVGLSLGGDPAMATYRRIGIFWALVPVVSSIIAYSTATLLRHDRIPEQIGIALLGGIVGTIVANISLSIVPVPGRQQASLARYISVTSGIESPTLLGGYDFLMALVSVALGVIVFAVLYRRLADSIDAGTREFLIGLGALVAFSSGGSQVGLATGPLETLFTTQLEISGIYLLGLGAIGILSGAWMGAPRLLQAVAREYSQLGIRRSIAALVPGFIIAQTAITLGIPISFNNIIISSVIGSGLVEGRAGVSARKILFTLGAWLTSLVSATAIGFGLYRALAIVAGA